MHLTIDDLPVAIGAAKRALRADLPGYAATFRELEGDIARQVDAPVDDILPIVVARGQPQHLRHTGRRHVVAVGGGVRDADAHGGRVLSGAAACQRRRPQDRAENGHPRLSLTAAAWPAHGRHDGGGLISGTVRSPKHRGGCSR